MFRLRVLGLMSVLLLLCGTAWADMIGEPPREEVLTGTLSWESIKNSDGSTKEKRLVLIVEKDKESKIYLPVTSGTNVKATKAGETIDVGTFVGKRVKMTVMVNRSWARSVTRIEEAG